MTYNEWKDELKSNLLCVSEAERRRVLDYYAEAYADRREAGFSEREIIEDFGAPYDAAQRILYDTPESYSPSDKAGAYSGSGYNYDRQQRKEDERREREQRKMEREREREREREERQREREERERARYSGESKSVGGNGYGANTNGYGSGGGYNGTANDYNRPNGAYGGAYNGNTYSGNYNGGGSGSYNNPEPKRKKNVVLIIVLCVLFAVPGIGLLCGIIGGAIGFIAAPFAMIIGGGANIGAGIGMMVAGHVGEGLSTLGGGMVAFGLGLLIIPLLRGFVKFCIKMFKKLVKWLKNLFNDYRRTV